MQNNCHIALTRAFSVSRIVSQPEKIPKASNKTSGFCLDFCILQFRLNMQKSPAR